MSDHRYKKRTWWRVAAASIILFLGVGSYFLFFNKNAKHDAFVKKEQIHDVPAPDVTRATLKLTDGTVVYLDSAKNGSLAVQGNVNIVKLADGQIKYTAASVVNSQEVKYNTITNPRGSKVTSITLVDGTQVWLNAASSITYPTSFVGKERKVEITGEAYFEVSKDASKKFIVASNGVSTEVLGTHFNVNAYSDEAIIRVTLLEGSVKVSRTQIPEFKIIKPGEQAQIDDKIKVVNDVDVEQVMAWKNGRFEFGESTGLKEIMRQISRWYDIDIVYDGDISQDFGGSISRQVNISKVLEKFELTGRVHFKIEDKKITVMK
jgi:ferric-dicitrate binding protein FerR (iron transport regulator)